MRTLLGHPGIDINKGTNVGWTPLYIACKNCDKAVLELLMQHPGIDVKQAFKDEYIS